MTQNGAITLFHSPLTFNEPPPPRAQEKTISQSPKGQERWRAPRRVPAARCGRAPRDTHSAAEATSPSSRTSPAPRPAWTLRFWFSFGTASSPTRPRRRPRRPLPPAAPQPGVARKDCRMFAALSAPAAAGPHVRSFPEVGPLRDAARGRGEGRPGTPGQGHGPPRAAQEPLLLRGRRRRRLRPVNFPRAAGDSGSPTQRGAPLPRRRGTLAAAAADRAETRSACARPRSERPPRRDGTSASTAGSPSRRRFRSGISREAERPRPHRPRRGVGRPSPAGRFGSPVPDRRQVECRGRDTRAVPHPAT